MCRDQSKTEPENTKKSFQDHSLYQNILSQVFCLIKIGSHTYKHWTCRNKYKPNRFYINTAKSFSGLKWSNSSCSPRPESPRCPRVFQESLSLPDVPESSRCPRHLPHARSHWPNLPFLSPPAVASHRQPELWQPASWIHSVFPRFQ